MPVVVFHDFEVYTNVGESKLSFKTSLSLAMARWWWAGFEIFLGKTRPVYNLVEREGEERGQSSFTFAFFYLDFLIYHFFCFYILITFYILLVKTRPVWRREGEGEAVASQLAHGSSMASELMT